MTFAVEAAVEQRLTYHKLLQRIDAVRNDRSLLPQAIEEALRFEPPLLTINRTTTCEVELGGVYAGMGQ